MSKDTIFDALLTEAAGDDLPDVTVAVLRAAVEEGTVAGVVETAPETRLAAAPNPESKPGRLVSIIGWSAAACAAIAIGWILLLWDTPGSTHQPGPRRGLPETVAVVGGGFEYENNALHVTQGLAVLREGAPPVHVAGSTIMNVKGVALVRPGQAPGEDELAEYSNSLRSGGSLKPEELEMLKDRKWIVRGGVAVCVLAGSIALNGDIIEAQVVRTVETGEAKEVESVEKRAVELMAAWDKNDDHVITGEEFVEELEAFDLNGDKKVTLEEFTDFLNSIEAAERKDAERAKKAQAEIEKRATEAGNKKAGDFIGKLDKNKDGTVDADEAKGLGAEAEGWMKKLDSDANGEISKEEADKYFKKESLKEEKAAAEKKAGPPSAIGGMRVARLDDVTGKEPGPRDPDGAESKDDE